MPNTKESNEGTTNQSVSVGDSKTTNSQQPSFDTA